MADPCRHGLPGSLPIAELDADVMDRAFLTAARFFFVCFAEQDETAWVSAILTPEAFFPDTDSAEKLRRVLAVVHEMRMSRRTTFRFSNPRCRGCATVVTPDERHLLQLIQHLRSGRGSQAASSAMLLCEGNPTSRLLDAGRDLAEMIEPAVPRYEAV